MNAPLIQYAKTGDGYNIAYTVSGEGDPFLLTPCLLQNDIMRHPEGLGDFVAAMAKRFRVVRYDGRGTGNSTRRVRPNTTLGDLQRDLLAVVEELRLDRFVLYGDVFSSYMLLDAASRLRNAVRALILVNPVPLNGAPFMPQWEQLYTNSWDQFINLFASTYGVNIREVVDHEDFVRLALSARGYCLTDVLGNVNTPTLVFAGRNQINPAVLATAQEIASTIPNGRLVLFDGYRLSKILSAPDQQLPPAVRVIEEFLSNLSNSREELTDTPWGTDAGLSQREIEVLRLLAAGKSNQQIADELVISLNTVLRHVSNIFAKTGATNRTEAAGYFRDRLLV